eukprot:CAMPEP_0198291446 /NCGR_PEP_ID=MMETSP1449-20131203/8972_1 /TAXON_ID=420275 /ORGANISM="Attheya septentrionalis, Strain CCMP2084" /LENGTH=1017 /DNA_ID=CAMNT_0043990085 /DNA_START=286 /DNA_END=3339 /DNA_ORIENTATION=+
MGLMLHPHQAAHFQFKPYSLFRKKTSLGLSLSEVDSSMRKPDKGSSKIVIDPVSPKLVRSLDLVPLFEGVARHTGTRRGREAFLKLVHIDNVDKSKIGWQQSGVGNRPVSRREQLKHLVTMYDTEMGSEERAAFSRQPEDVTVAKIAESAAEAKQEYELVRQATAVLLNQTDRVEHRGLESEQAAIPPLYGYSSSPWDVEQVAKTDDDEWLFGRENSDRSPLLSLELEQILQAEQVVKRLLDVRAWGESAAIQSLAPALSQIGQLLDDTILHEVHRDIVGTVEIVRGARSLMDPTGTKSFSFRLRREKFPSLKVLYENEQDLMKKLDGTMKGLLNNKDFASNVLNPWGDNKISKPESFDFDGRIVVSVPRQLASKIGTVRGYSKTASGICYVEPKNMIEDGNRLGQIRDELAAAEREIQQHLTQSIRSGARFIDAGLNIIARLDVIFAKAAFGCTMNGSIPHVGKEGTINVHEFVHPVLVLHQPATTRNTHDNAYLKSNPFQRLSTHVVPLDLVIGRHDGDGGHPSLIISGPNGGGKTLALKSFGLAAVMCKVAIPIPSSVSKGTPRSSRVDFFSDILVDIGDQQNILEGESTLMARLHSGAEIIRSVSHSNEDSEGNHSPVYPLVLLDELGSGTDPEAGAAIAQAMLEKMLENDRCRIVATTHSPQLKLLSVNDARFNCATVLLKDTPESRFKIPTFKLVYGIVGDSYALGAASRASLPEDVLARAADLMAGGVQGEGDALMDLAASLEHEKEVIQIAREATEKYKDDIMMCRDATISLCRAYGQHMSRLENRLETILSDLKNETSRSDYDLVGDTIAELRLVKRRTKSLEDVLKERGLKALTPTYELKDGESVVIVAEGEWECQTATVMLSPDPSVILAPNEVAVVPSMDWEAPILNLDSLDYDEQSKTSASATRCLVFKRTGLASWDYPDEDIWGWKDNTNDLITSTSESKHRLREILTNLKPAGNTPKSGIDSGSLGSNHNKAENKNEFSSSRERKAATAAAKKDRKKSKKKK